MLALVVRVYAFANFVCLIEESFGKRHVIVLKHGGKHIFVTNENKMQYAHVIADYKLNRYVTNYHSLYFFIFGDNSYLIVLLLMKEVTLTCFMVMWLREVNLTYVRV